MFQGEVWAAPLTWLIYALVMGFLILTSIGALISLFLGTPGCEYGPVGEMIRRLRGVRDPERAEPMWCILGLHRIDAWETRRAARS